MQKVKNAYVFIYIDGFIGKLHYPYVKNATYGYLVQILNWEAILSDRPGVP